MTDHEQVNSKLITYEQLAENFHLPINEVSKKLGICTTVLKKVCRRNGIPRWPYRKLKAIDKKISNLKTSLQKNPQESKRIHAEIVALQEQKRLIMENPSCLTTAETTEQTFDEVYDDLNSSALLLSLTPNRDSNEENQSPDPPVHHQPRSARLCFSAERKTEEEEEELMVALNLVELMSQSQATTCKTDSPSAPPQPQQPQNPQFSSSTAVPLFTSSHPPFSTLPSFAPPTTSSPPPSFTTSRPNSTSPPPFPNMPIINPRSFFSPEERAPPIPHTQQQMTTTTPHTPRSSHLRSFSSAPFLETVPEEQQPPLPSWFSRSLEEAVSGDETPEPKPTRPETPAGLKRAGRDVVSLEAESRTHKNPLTTKRSRNQSPNFQALGFPSLVSVAPRTPPA